MINIELKDRIRTIITEKHLKQKDFAISIKVTESYISNMLSGKRNGISEPLAFLIEEIYGYSAKWILNGEGEKYASYSKDSSLSPSKKSLISDLEKMSDNELIAVRAFINSLEDIKTSLKK